MLVVRWRIRLSAAMPMSMPVLSRFVAQRLETLVSPLATALITALGCAPMPRAAQRALAGPYRFPLDSSDFRDIAAGGRRHQHWQ